MPLIRSLLFSLIALSAAAQIPNVPGYRQIALSHNISLPVRVVGGNISEQEIPVILYLPEPGAGIVESTKPAKAIPGLPSNLAGYHLVTLADTVRFAMSLRSGQRGQVELPLFAYLPDLPTSRPAELLAALPSLSSDKPVSAPKATQPSFTPPQAPLTVPASAEAVVFAPKAAPASVVVAPESKPAALAAPPAEQQRVEIVLTPKAPAAEVSPFEQTTSATPAPVNEIAAEPAAAKATWDEVLSPNYKFETGITVGELIVDERQSLRNRMPVHVEFMGRPLNEVLLSLATTSGIDFSLGAIPGSDSLVTSRFTCSPFAALEQIARQFGVGVYREKNDPLWTIRKMDPETLIARTYSLKHIQLGNSSGATGDGKSFGSGLDETLAANYNRGGSGSSGGSSSGFAGGSLGSQTGSSGSGQNGTLSGINLPHSTSTFSERFTTASDVLLTIRSILAQADAAPLVSDLKPADERGDNPRLTTNPNASTQPKSSGLVSYNSDTGTVLVIATEQKQQWVSEYLSMVDRPVALIAIDAMFVESDAQPSSKMGADWSGTFVDWNVNGPSSLDFGTLGHLKVPTDIAIATSGFATKVSAFIANTKSRVARYPRVVTTNNREVRIGTTSNIPIITQAATVAGVSGANVQNGTVTNNTVQTNYSAGTQQIGTIITILPMRIGDTENVHLKISIEISSGSASSSGGTGTGESLTGRIPTTSTTYEGEVTVPNGHTLALGGLERIAEQSNIGRVPGLSKIPLFGFIFKKEEANFGNTNITLFVTPRLLAANDLPVATGGGNGGIKRALNNSAALDQRAATEAKK